MRKFLLVAAAVALSAFAIAQSFGPRTGSVTWTYPADGGYVVVNGTEQVIDGGFICLADGGVCADGGTSCNSCSGTCCTSDGGWIDGGFLYDGGNYDAGIQLACCADGGFGTWQGPYTCVTIWNDAGYDPGTGGYNDGGFSDGGCTDAGVISNGNWIDGGLYDAGIQEFQNPYYTKDAGPVDGGFLQYTASHYTWLPVAAAIYAGSVQSDPILLAGFVTAAGCHGALQVSSNGGANVQGTLCLNQGYSGGPWEDAGCKVLDGSVSGPYTFDIGPIYSPALEFNYTPSSADDGGYVYGNFTVTNY